MEYLVGVKVLEELKKYISFENNLDQCLKKIVQLLKQNYPKYTWVGIYLVEGNELTLHNYLGRPTSLTSIPIDQGICGAAVQEKRAIIVPEVNADARYLACSVETRSEIVVPIMAKDSVLGEIDIDSDFKDIFHEGDVEILEQCAAVVAGKMSSNIED
ncbi:MAG: GAF domain-containing protein [bacterium]